MASRERPKVWLRRTGWQPRSPEAARHAPCACCWSTITPRCAATTSGGSGGLGHTVVEAANGAEALKALKTRECDYDLLISDYAMPHLSGTEFLREARELCPEAPALIITGYAEADAISDRPPGVEVLLKPFTATQLETTVQLICSDKAVVS